MTKKTAILTQPLKSNYGGIIQNYALQKVLKNLGYEPLTVDIIRSSKLKLKLRSFIMANEALTKTINFIFNRNIPMASEEKEIFKHNLEFIEIYIARSERINGSKKLKYFFEKENFDAVIVGSDQTWRPKYSPNIYNYFLDFIDDNNSIKKIAYASSFGTDEWEYTKEETEKCKKLAKQFDAVSVREDSGIKLCEEYLEIPAVHLLDPTLLLTADDYNELINRPKEKKELLTYILDETEEKSNMINFCSKELGLKINRNNAKYTYLPEIKRDIKDLVFPPIENWLQGFRDADFVITDSFHGTVFSIINKKPFIAIGNESRGMSRFSSILKMFGLEERLIVNYNELSSELINKTIDWDKTNEILEKERLNSLNFLSDNLL